MIQTNLHLFINFIEGKGEQDGVQCSRLKNARFFEMLRVASEMVLGNITLQSSSEKGS